MSVVLVFASCMAWSLHARPIEHRSSGPGNVAESTGKDYTTGFEPAEGFVLGPIDGQGGWVSLPASTNAGQVGNLNAAIGLQHLRIRHDPAAGINTTVGVISPNLGTFTESSAVVSVDVFITGSDRDYQVVPQSPSEGLVVTRVRFRRLKNIIEVLDDPEGDGSFAFIDTGVAWIADQYINLTIDLNIAANSVDITYNGAVIYTMAAAVVLGTAVQEVALVGLNGIPTGYADRRFEHPRMAAFVELEKQARSARRGLWKDITKDTMPPWRRKLEE